MTKQTALFISIPLSILLNLGTLFAEEGILVVYVADTKEQPISGVQMSIEGTGTISPPSDRSGKTRIRLTHDTRAGDWVTLLVVKWLSHEQELVFISPWNRRVIVPPFDNEAVNYASIILAKRSDKALLRDDKALEAITASILERLSPKSPKEELTEEQKRAVLTEQAQKYGLEPSDVDRAIRLWKKRTKDPYEKGLAALYEENYPEATKQLTESLEIRIKDLEEAQARVVDAAFFLGQSLYKEGRYQESADAYKEALTLRQNDSEILNNLGLSLHLAGRYAEAEPLYKQALEIYKKALGPEHPHVATSINNLAGLYRAQGRYEEAEPLFKQALEMRKKALGPEHPDVARSINNLAELYRAQGRYEEAEPLHKQALEIYKKALGPEHPHVATVLENYAQLLRKTNREAEAVTLEKEAKAIRNRYQSR